MNALAAVTIQDIVRPNFKGIPELRLTKLAKVIGKILSLMYNSITCVIVFYTFEYKRSPPQKKQKQNKTKQKTKQNRTSLSHHVLNMKLPTSI